MQAAAYAGNGRIGQRVNFIQCGAAKTFKTFAEAHYYLILRFGSIGVYFELLPGCIGCIVVHNVKWFNVIAVCLCKLDLRHSLRDAEILNTFLCCSWPAAIVCTAAHFWSNG
jgi:hypothetical protein